ncbi:CD99 antigen-like protein 2 isoform X2 [Anabas testudineus]|uniref:CD99 antigen-like protein 2 n=1 Tax=Anabas testudineus TaxID=64144 RepID=A0A7N6ASI3_ANATE|nr:CD99 antigen-like protein 2 isoform X2 [Anabas testudineus]
MNHSLWRLLLALLLPLEVLPQGFNLADALDGDDSKLATPAPKPAAPIGGAGGELYLGDAILTTTTKAPPKVLPKVPAGTKVPVKPKPKPAGGDLNLADALDTNNDIAGKDKGKERGGEFSDNDLIDVSKDDTYKPEKGKDGHPGDRDQINQYDDNTESLNTDMVKAENPEAVVATEPQVQQTLLLPPNAEPPTEENAV